MKLFCSKTDPSILNETDPVEVIEIEILCHVFALTLLYQFESRLINDVAPQLLVPKKAPKEPFRHSIRTACPCPVEFAKNVKLNSCRVFASKEIRLLYKGAPTLQKQ